MEDGRTPILEKHEKSLTPTEEFALILLLFITSRLMLLLTFPPENLTRYNDYQKYYELSALSVRGLLPFISYWSDIPPLFPLFSLAIYHLSAGIIGNYVFICGLLLLIVESLSLYILFLLAKDISGERAAIRLSWAYSLLFVPVYVWLSAFEAFTAFFLMATLLFIRHRRLVFAGLAIGLGALTQIIPIIMLLTVWRARGWKATTLAAAITTFMVLLFASLFYLRSPMYTWASLSAISRRSSEYTMWALIDGNVDFERETQIGQYLDAGKAFQSIGHDSRFPLWFITLPFLILGLYVLFQPRIGIEMDEIVITTLLVSLFFLWSGHWEPRWQIFYIPLLLLSFPFRRALLFIVSLAFVNLLENPLLLSRGMFQLLPLTITARTIIILMVVVELILLLRSTKGASVQPKVAA